MITYPGLPAPVICDFLSREQSRARYAPGTEFQIGMIELCANTGTYLDSPFHRYPAGADLADLPLERLAELDAVVVDVSGQTGRAVDRNQLLPYDVARKAVLVRTGWDRHWRTDAYVHGHPFLTAAAAEHLAAEGAALRRSLVTRGDTDGLSESLPRRSLLRRVAPWSVSVSPVSPGGPHLRSSPRSTEPMT